MKTTIIWSLLLLFPILPIFSKYLWWKYTNREMNYKHIIVDILYLIFAWGYIPFIFYIIAYFDQNPPSQVASNSFFHTPYIETLVVQLIICLIFVFPIIISYVYWFFYKKYFKQINQYFALQIFICYLIIPFLVITLIEILAYYFWLMK